MCGKHSSPQDRMWPGHFPLELTRLVVNLTIGEADLPATADATRRYGEFVVQNSIVSGGNALLGYEPRYDFCRCDGFWPRTRHAISRNFVAYNRTERELRPQIPTYTGAFAAGLLYNTWLPGKQNIWSGGAYNMLSQAGIGSGYNFVSEFALDILHAFGLKKT